ncbi:hypothetical protein SBA4_1960001 [Candidatus Sulfopaludibacter sp. SbA4]|nr:hypothetical protein SBA4_1960001 [Candidatus Sulfopaludibacter sp. SbA4]
MYEGTRDTNPILPDVAHAFQKPLDNPLILRCLWCSQFWLPPASAGVWTFLSLVKSEVGHSVARSETIAFCRLSLLPLAGFCRQRRPERTVARSCRCPPGDAAFPQHHRDLVWRAGDRRSDRGPQRFQQPAFAAP